MEKEPYISFVVVARNDNHGGDMLHRMQIFTTCLLQQCKKYNLPSELVIVEWNPPAGAKNLHEVLDWNVPGTPCQVRFIEFPFELHKKVKYWDKVPLYQMIGKNVGIRRSRGKFVCATNLDIIFNDALFEEFAKMNLLEDGLYRIDRWDTDRHVPLATPLAEQLQYCEENILRVNQRGRTATWAQIMAESGVHEPEHVQHSIWAKTILQLRHNWHTHKKDVDKESFFWKAASNLIPRRLKAALFNDNIFAKLAYYTKDVPTFILGLWILVPPEIRNDRTLIKPFYDALRYVFPTLNDRIDGHMFKMADLHTNACGDFTMLSRSNWFRLRGYDEFAGYSWNTDSIVCHQAVAFGLKEIVLEDPCRIYHIEHGSGWTPETEKGLFGRLRANKVPYITNYDFAIIAEELFLRRRSPIINDENWGFGTTVLEECGNALPVVNLSLV